MPRSSVSSAGCIQVSVSMYIYIQYSPGSVESVQSRSHIPQLEVSIYGAAPFLLQAVCPCEESHTLLYAGKTIKNKDERTIKHTITYSYTQF